MYIRVLFGRYAGEVQDIEPVNARALKDSGRGQDPDLPWPPDEASEPVRPPLRDKKTK